MFCRQQVDQQEAGAEASDQRNDDSQVIDAHPGGSGAQVRAETLLPHHT